MAKKKTTIKEKRTAKKSTHYRNADTGQYVSKDHADKHPKTTVKEKDKDKGTDHTGPRRK